MIQTERPLADGRRTVVFVFRELKLDGGRLTQMWMSRLRSFVAAGWSAHAAVIKKDPQLDATLAELTAQGRLPREAAIHPYSLRDRRVRPEWWAPLAAGESIDPRVGSWLDWLTARVPGAVVIADSPSCYPYVAAMTNPLVARVAGIHLNHLTNPSGGTDPLHSPMTPRFAERFEPHHRAFDSLVVMTQAQADDLRVRFGRSAPTVVIPPAVSHVTSRPAAHGAATSARRIVAVGPLEAESRHDEAIRACRAALRGDPTLTLDIVGDGDAAEALQDLARQLGIARQVRVLPPPRDEVEVYEGAHVTLWTGRRESHPLSLIRALATGIPVVAYDVRYGPAQVITHPDLGVLVPSGDVQALADAVAERLALPADPEAVHAAAGPLIRRCDPAAVGARWVELAEELSTHAWDGRGPIVLVESVSTAARVLRMPGVLVNSSAELTSWSIELPGLVEPAGWLVEPAEPGVYVEEDPDAAPPDEHATTIAREVVVNLRSNALSYVVTEGGAPFRLDLTDGSTTVPLQANGFEQRLMASRVGNATLTRHADGTVWVDPLRELLLATNADGRILVQQDPDGPFSDVTHAISWGIDIDWGRIVVSEEGVAFTGTLRATGIAPADDSTPSLCITDVGGYSRAVGDLEYVDTPVVDGPSWSVRVAGMIHADPLVATTQLARGALALHVGFRGLLVPVGGLWTRGDRSPIAVQCPRGLVTLLPSPGGRVLAAPGRGYRARASRAFRSAFSRGS